MGQIFAGGSSRLTTAEQLRLIVEMRQALTQIPVPTLWHADNPNEYVFFAMLDGSGQDFNKPELGLPTNVGLLYQQAEKLEDDPGSRIGTHYTRGIGSQSSWLARGVDGALALTWDDAIKEMYRELAEQAEEWKQQNPEAQIRLAGLGYSRGAVQQAGFHRLVDQYGIASPEGLKFGRDALGNITVESARPPLVPPGQVAQVAFLLDPVATNMPRNYDARLPSSAISRAAVMAANEQREWFPQQTINDPGLSADRHSINVSAPGGHSNIGGGSREPGIEILIGNAAVDYLNLLSDKPLFVKRPVPEDLSAFTVYQASGMTAGFGLAMDRDGQRNLRDELANCKIVDPCRDSEPVDRELAAKFEYRHIQPDPREQAQLQSLIAQATAREQDAAMVGERRTATPAAPLLPFSNPGHPQHALYADARTRLQAGGHDYPEDRLSQVAAQLHKMDIRPGWNGYVMEQAGQIWVRDVDPWGQHARIDLSVPASSVQESLQAVQAHDIAEQQRTTQDRQQEMARGQHAPAM